MTPDNTTPAPTDATNSDDFICDFCAEIVPETEINDCEPDELGFCIRCGKQISEPNDE